MQFSTADHIALRCLAAPDRPAFTIGSGQPMTYGEAWKRACGLAAVLDRCPGGRHGRTVGLLLPNSADAVLAIVASQLAGTIAVPVNGRLSPTEMRYILEDADCRLLLTAHPFLEISQRATDGLAIEVVDATRVRTPEKTPRPIPALRDIGNEPTVIGYTSGTTGFPKGAIYTHDYYTMNNYRWGWEFGLTGDHTVLIAGPMFHLSYAGFALAGLTIGATMRVLPEFSAGAALDELDSHCSFAFLVPTMLKLMADEWRSRGCPKAVRARHIISAGAPATLELLRTVMAMFPNARVAEMYGWTEGSFVTYEVKKADTLVPNCVGWPAVGADVQVFDEQGEPCTTGVTGEVGVRSPVPFGGYLAAAEATEGAYHKGYLLSGDIGRFLPDGRLCIVDRKKDVIITGGENVYTVEVERVLLEHPAIRECAVIGVPDVTWGERVSALLVLDPALRPTVDDLATFCKARLAAYKVPRQFHSTDTLPRNSMGKVQKPRVAELLAKAGAGAGSGRTVTHIDSRAVLK